MRAPTSIINRQRRLVEVGRIRLGVKGAKGAPKAIDTFRLTSRNRTALEQAAALWGGEVVPWEGHAGQFDLVTNASEIPIWVAPQPPSQAYEFWQKGGIQRRCDGEKCWLMKEGKEVPKKCACFNGMEQTEFGLGKDGCKLYTRVQVMLPDIPAVGVWLLTTQSFYAGAEIPTVLGYLQEMTPAVLAIERRERVSNNQTKKFVVPVIRLEAGMTFRTVMTGELPSDVPALPPQSLSDDVHEDFVEEEESGESEGQETPDTGQIEYVTIEAKPYEIDRSQADDRNLAANVPDWPVFDGEPEVDAKLRDLGFSPRDAQDLFDAGVSGEQVLESKATTKESLLLEVE